MIGGIFETIGQTLGVGEDKYFLELDDTAENSIPAAKPKTAAKTVETAKKESADIVKQGTDIAKATTDKAKTVKKEAKTAAAPSQQQAEPVAPKAEKSAAKANAAAKKTAPAKKKKAASPTEQKKAAPPEQVAQSEAPAVTGTTALIVNAITAAGPKPYTEEPTDAEGNVVTEATTFATDFLMPLGNRGRRRPGPGLGTFKKMAKDIRIRV